MPDRQLLSWLYPAPTGDRGRDRNARTVHFVCLLLACAVIAMMGLDLIERDPAPLPQLIFALVAFIAAIFMNRAGGWTWAARSAFFALLMTAVLLVVQARDGFRSHAMLVFPGLLLLSVMLLDRLSYMITAGIVLVAVAALGFAEKAGLTHAVPHVRTSTTYGSIFSVDLIILVIALIGGRVARDSQDNVSDLRATIERLTTANQELGATVSAWRESQRQLSSIYDSVRDVIFFLAVGPDGRFRFASVNLAFLRTTGLTREAVVGRTVDEVVPQPSLATVLSKYREAIQGKRAVSWEETSTYPTGRLTGIVTIVPLFDDTGVCTHLVGSVHDITESKRTDAAMRESEERFRRIFEEGPLGLALIGKDNRFLRVNRALCDMVAYPEEDLLEKSFAAITHKDDLQADLALSNRLFRGEIPFFRLQKRYLKKTGETIWINLTASMIHDRDGKPLYGLAMIEDITDVKRAQDEAFERQKLESIGVLVNGIAHDFNNLLGAVLAQAELAIEELRAGLRPAEQLREICAAAIRGSGIVRELMIYAGNEEDVTEPVNVAGVVTEMLDLLKLTISVHGTLAIDLRDNLPTVNARAAQIRQIVMNLVGNAAEAMEDHGGVIRVVAEPVTLEHDMNGAGPEPLRAGSYLQLAVSDNGCGMSRETQAKIFDPFFTTKSPGRGLGLAVVHGIIRSLGGAIRVESELGMGTSFLILLPCAEAAQAAAVGQNAIDEAIGGSTEAVVLVVEDEELLRSAERKMLQKAGFEVLEAANGTDAIELLRTGNPRIDLVLLDATIPGASSAEVIAAGSRFRPGLIVVLTSAYDKEMLGGDVSAAPVRAFVRKPFTFGDLVRTLRSALASNPA